jgi:hypothetical protein
MLANLKLDLYLHKKSTKMINIMKYEYLMIVAMTTKITLHYYTTIHTFFVVLNSPAN